MHHLHIFLFIVQSAMKTSKGMRSLISHYYCWSKDYIEFHESDKITEHSWVIIISLDKCKYGKFKNIGKGCL